MTAALSEDEHQREQRARYEHRRDRLSKALTDNGFRIDHSEAGLYLWATRAIPAMMRWRIWRGGEFWWRPAGSMGPAVESMCAWRSPRPMNASMPQRIA